MDIVNELLNMLFEGGILLLNYLSPYKFEIVVGTIFAMFVLSFIYSHK